MPLVDTRTLTEMCEAALRRVGAPDQAAHALAYATVEAERRGKSGIGVAHLLDYFDGYGTGRITAAEPLVTRLAPTMFSVTAAGGIVQSAFASVRDEFVAAVRQFGSAMLWINGGFTCGELGFYPRELANDGLISIACANSPALMAVGGSRVPVLGTNPLAFALPRPDDEPLVIDQASSATAFVNIRAAAETGVQIPAGWAIDAAGEPTQDAEAAKSGALLPFGGYRGGNIALLVELLATAAGANFSVDAPPFDAGSESPGTGFFVLGIDSSALGGVSERFSAMLESAAAEYGMHVPAVKRVRPLAEVVSLPTELLEELYRVMNGTVLAEG